MRFIFFFIIIIMRSERVPLETKYLKNSFTTTHDRIKYH